MTNAQMELGFDGRPLQKTANHRERRVARAGWWFARMRQIVNDAMDWPAAEPRPEQTWLPGTQRQAQA